MDDNAPRLPSTPAPAAVPDVPAPDGKPNLASALEWKTNGPISWRLDEEKQVVVRASGGTAASLSVDDLPDVLRSLANAARRSKEEGESARIKMALEGISAKALSEKGRFGAVQVDRNAPEMPHSGDTFSGLLSSPSKK